MHWVLFLIHTSLSLSLSLSSFATCEASDDESITFSLAEEGAAIADEREEEKEPGEARTEGVVSPERTIGKSRATDQVEPASSPAVKRKRTDNVRRKIASLLFFTVVQCTAR